MKFMRTFDEDIENAQTAQMLGGALIYGAFKAKDMSKDTRGAAGVIGAAMFGLGTAALVTTVTKKIEVGKSRLDLCSKIIDVMGEALT